MPVPQQFVEPDPVADRTGPQPGKHAKPRRRWRRIALISLLVVALLGGGGMIAGGLYLRSVESDIERVDAFADVPEAGRPQAVAKGAMNILILGSDTRDPESTSGSRTDTIILAHLPKDRSSAQLVSIPRDTWVSVPRSKDGSQGGRDAKINAAYAWGGVPLMVQTVEKFTSVRIDHVMMVDFAGFKEIIDALGGIDIDAEKTFTSIHPPFRTFRQGVQRMDGETALDYSRQRKQFPRRGLRPHPAPAAGHQGDPGPRRLRRHRHEPGEAELLRQGDVERGVGGREDVPVGHGDRPARPARQQSALHHQPDEGHRSGG
jgi:LCP family protein required for cell wall assembly